MSDSPNKSENRLHVRKYYQKHRSEIILQKLERACRLHGRVPRSQTIQEHEMPVDLLIDAFKQWLVTREAHDVLRVKRTARFRRMLAELRDLNLY